MKLSTAALQDAVRAHLSPAVAIALLAALAALHAGSTPDVVQDTQVGSILLAAILGPPCDMDPLTLTSCALVAGDTIALDPAETAEHPLLGPWIDQDLASAISSAVCAGTRATTLAIGAPRFDQVQIVQADGVLAGSVTLSFAVEGGAVAVAATYGEMRRTAPLLTSWLISGSALYDLGRQARLATKARGSAPASGSGGAVAVPLVVAGTGAVH